MVILGLLGGSMKIRADFNYPNNVGHSISLDNRRVWINEGIGLLVTLLYYFPKVGGHETSLDKCRKLINRGLDN